MSDNSLKISHEDAVKYLREKGIMPPEPVYIEITEDQYQNLVQNIDEVLPSFIKRAKDEFTDDLFLHHVLVGIQDYIDGCKKALDAIKYENNKIYIRDIYSMGIKIYTNEDYETIIGSAHTYYLWD